MTSQVGVSCCTQMMYMLDRSAYQPVNVSSVIVVCLGHLLPGEQHLYVGIHQVLVVPDEGLLHVGHDAGVHPGQTLGPVDLQVVAGPLALGGDPLWQEQVTATTNRWTCNTTVLLPLCVCVYMSLCVVCVVWDWATTTRSLRCPTSMRHEVSWLNKGLQQKKNYKKFSMSLTDSYPDDYLMLSTVDNKYLYLLYAFLLRLD